LPLAGARATARNDEHSPGQSHLHGIWKTFSWEILSFHQEKWGEKTFIIIHPILPLTSSDMFYACSSPLWWETKVEKVCKSRRPAPKTRNLRKVSESGAKGPRSTGYETEKM
jgi:hypothetical protein